jgi:antitoxin HigA-1
VTHMMRIENDFIPPAPGQVLREKLLEGLGLTQAQLARAIAVSRPRLNMMLKDRCQISADIALRIEKVFGIPPQFWFRVRAEFDLYEGRQRLSHELESLPQISLRDPTQAGGWLVSEWQLAA